MSFLLTQGVLQQQANRAGGKQYALEFDGEDDYVLLNQDTGIIKELYLDIHLVPSADDSSVAIFGRSEGEDYKYGLLYITREDSLNPKWDRSNSRRTDQINFGNNIDKIKILKNQFYFNDQLIAEEPHDYRLNTFNYIGRRQSGLYLKGYITVLKIINVDDVTFDYDFTNPDPNKLHDKENGNHGTIYGANWIEL